MTQPNIHISKEYLMSRITNVKQYYLKPFNYVQKND